MSLAAFHDVRLPLNLSFGAEGGPERRTDIVPLASGREARNAVWAGSRRRWELGGAITRLADLQTLIMFFEARMGPLYGFRFRDVIDDGSHAPGRALTPFDQQLGLGDGTQDVFELVKSYGQTTRRIFKPVAGSVRVAVDGVEVYDGVISPGAGTVRFRTPPARDAQITAGFRFDVPVRFDSDRLDTSLEGFEAGRAASVPIIELTG